MILALTTFPAHSLTVQLYLSSFKLGEHADTLSRLIDPTRPAAYIPNAIDHLRGAGAVRRGRTATHDSAAPAAVSSFGAKSAADAGFEGDSTGDTGVVEETGRFLRDELGLTVEVLDLRDYFGDAPAATTRDGRTRDGRTRDAEASQGARQGVLTARDLERYGTIWVRGGNVFVLRRAMQRSGFDRALRAASARVGLLYGGYSAGACVLSPTLRGLHLVDDPRMNPYGGDDEVPWEGLGVLPFSFLPHADSHHPESAAMARVVSYCRSHGLPYRSFRDGQVLIRDRAFW